MKKRGFYILILMLVITPVYGAESFYNDIRDFGAVSGSEVDNYNAIQAAIDSLGTDGGTVLIPEGTYCTSQTLKVRTGNVEIIGVGPDSSRLCLLKDTDGDLIHLDVDEKDEWFAIKDLTLEGGKDRGARGRALYTGAGQSSIRDVHLYNLFITSFDDVSVELDDGWGTIIDNVVIEFGNSDAIVVNHGNDVKITNCKIIQNKGSAIVINDDEIYHTKIVSNLLNSGDDKPVISLRGRNGIVSSNTIIDDGDYENNTGMIVYGKHNMINNNLIMNSRSKMNYGIILTESSEGNLVVDNQISTNEIKNNVIDNGNNIFVGKRNLWSNDYYLSPGGNLYLNPVGSLFLDAAFYQYGKVDGVRKYVKSWIKDDVYLIESEDNTIRKMKVDMPVEVKGLILKSPNGDSYCCNVDDSGILSCSQGSC